MNKSIITLSYTLSIAAFLSLAPQAWGAPNEQAQQGSVSQQGSVTQNQAAEGSVTQNQAQSGNTVVDDGSVVDIPGTTTPPTSGTPPMLQDPVKEAADSIAEETKGGVSVGNFLVYPDLSATLMFDDNIYSSRDNTVSDKVLIISPEVRVKPNFNRDALELGVGGNFNRYSDHHDEDTNNGWGYIKGRVDLTNSTNVYANARLSRDHEDRSSSDANQLLQTNSLAEPTRYKEFSGGIGIYHRFTDDLSIRLGSAITKLEYEDTPITGSTVPYSNEYRDIKKTLTGGRITFSATKTVNVFIQGLIDRREYDNTYVDFNHHSDGFSAALGVQIKPTKSLSAEAYIGQIRQTYENSAFDDVSEVDFGLNVAYKMTPKTTFSIYLDRSLEETTLADSSGYLNTSLTGRVHEQVTRDLSVYASLSRHHSSYNNYYRSDDFTAGSMGAKYYVSNAFYASMNYQYRQRNSTTAYAEYDNNIVYITLGTNFGTRAKTTTP